MSVAASDFYGPRVREAHAGERMVPTILAGKPMRVLGALDQPHSFTFVPDLAAAMIAAARDRTLWNRFLLAPTAPGAHPASAGGGVRGGRWRAGAQARRHPGVAAAHGRGRAPATRELAETAYQFTAPFVLDSTASEARLGLDPTPLDIGVRETVRWWRANTRTETAVLAA